MKESVLPLEMILFQTLLLLVAIDLEARVFYRRLNVGRQTSIKYAISINLLATIISWLVFFIAKNWFPQDLEEEVIGFIFFDRVSPNQTQQITLLTVSIIIAIFFATFLVKLKGLDLLQALLQDTPILEDQDQDQDENQEPANKRIYWETLANRFNQATVYTDPNQATTVLLANAFSYSGIMLILFTRFLLKDFG